MCKYYGYCRVSTQTQAEKGGGLEVQKKAIENYAQANGYKLEQIFIDAGISGTTESRPELDRLLLETIERGDVIIVHNTSRLWRNIFAQATILKVLDQAGADIKSIDEPEFSVYGYLHDPDNFMISGMFGMLDQSERMTIARKLARGRTNKAAKGDKPAGMTPYGYQYSADKKHIEVKAAEAEAVKMMFSEAQRGTSLNGIAKKLNAQRISTKRGGEWKAGTVQAILHNRFYIGELTHQGNTIQGKHEPIVSKVQFGKVQAQLEKRIRNSREG